MKRKLTAVISALSLCASLAFAGETGTLTESSKSIQTLLEGYLRNDLTLQNLSAEVGKQILEKEITEIDNSWSFTLETGTVTITTGESAGIELNPEVTVTVPQANNLTLGLESTVSLAFSDSAETGLEDTSLSLSADIISSTAAERKIALLKAEREVLELQRKLQNQFVQAEKDFYSELKDLYSIATEIVKAEKDLYEDQLDFEQIVAQGYSKTSSKYRTAQMEVLSDQHTVETARHKLEREVRIFASECGAEYDCEDPMDFLPADIPAVEAVDVLSFDKEDYTEIESAKWTQYINTLTREAETEITLTGSAGYTFNNSKTSSDTVDVASSFKWKDTGLGLSAGVSVPVNSSSAPVYSFGVSFDPLALKKAGLEDQQEELTVKQEELAVQSAEISYDTAVISQQSELNDIEWNRSTNAEALELYTDLEADTLKWFKQGIVNESEYKTAAVNKENYRIQCIVNDIELIIYNDETTLLFCRDQELKHEREIEQKD